MSDERIKENARRVREYLATTEARRRWAEYRSGRGWSWERFVAESALYITRVVKYETLTEIVREVGLGDKEVGLA